MRPDLPVMLFAAGLGTRMEPLTNRVPKPLIKVAGKPLAEHALDQVQGAGLTRVMANTHYLADMVSHFLTPLGVRCVFEPEILETGGGLKSALPVLGPGPVITLNTDAVWVGPNPVARLLGAWRPDIMDALLLVVSGRAAVGHSGAGDFALGPGGRLTRKGGLVYTGLQIIKTDRLADITEQKFSLNLVWDLMAGDRRLYGLPHIGQWCDVGRPESIGLAEKMLEQADV